MASVACLLLLLSCRIAGQAIPPSFLATGWQDKQGGQIGVEATSKGCLDNVCNKPPSAMHVAGKPDEMLVKRTSHSSSHRPRSPCQQRTGGRPVLPNHISPVAPSARHIQGGDHSGWPALSTSTSSHTPAVGPSAPSTEPGSASKQQDKPKRRPHRSLKNNPALRAEAERDRRALAMKRIKSGERINKTKPGGGKYTITTFDDFQASQTARNKRTWSNLTPEAKAKNYERRNKRKREVRAKIKAQQIAQREGRSWEGSPLRKPGRPRRNWDQEQAGTKQGRPHVPSDTRMEEATQRVVGGPDARPATVWSRPLESSSGSWPVLESLSGASHHPFARGSSSPTLDFGLSLSAPGASKSWQKRPSPQLAPTAEGPREEKRLRPTLAPPGQHDRLRLTLAQPRHN